MKLANFVLSFYSTVHQSLWVILCHLPEKGEEELVDEMKETNRRLKGKANVSVVIEEILAYCPIPPSKMVKMSLNAV